MVGEPARWSPVTAQPGDDGTGAAGRDGRFAATCGVAAVLILAGVAAAGESAAVPGLGPRTLLPPWDLAVRVALTVSGPAGSEARFDWLRVEQLQ